MSNKMEQRICRACDDEAQPEASQLNCPCDHFVHPPALKIAAGMDTIPRQLAMFAEFRRAMLAALGTKPALAGWRGRNSEDFGVMLLEMWAYVCDVLAFYDETIAHESYLRTARLRPALRKLVGLLGYVPRPAAAAMVELAVLAEGRQPVTLPAGTAFRSSAFQGQPPQVFEIEKAITVHPFSNQWNLNAPCPTTLGEIDDPSVLTVRLTAPLSVGMPLLIRVGEEPAQIQTPMAPAEVSPLMAQIVGASASQHNQSVFPPLPNAASPYLKASTIPGLLPKPSPGSGSGVGVVFGATIVPELLPEPSPQCAVRTIARLVSQTTGDGMSFMLLRLNTATNLPANTKLDRLELYTPTQRAGVWTQDSKPPASKANSSIPEPIENEPGAYQTWLTLDTVYRPFRATDDVLVQKADEYRWFRVSRVTESLRQASASGQITINGNEFETPGVSMPVTRILLDTDLNDEERKVQAKSGNWTNDQRDELTVHYGMQLVGRIVAVPRNAPLSPGDALCVTSAPDVPPANLQPSRFTLQDNNQTGLVLGGKLDFATRELKPNPGTTWSSALVLPVQLFGNIVNASRGETVRDEILGSGDASQANQSFKLKKSPLTYTLAPSGSGTHQLVSSLCIYVNGIRWTEVENFFGQKEQAQVYIVRQNDDGESIVTFGDGKRGARLPTGKNNVIAHYRYGAGAASPPAGSITQIARPAKGLRAVKNPVAAFGGADAEDAAGLRTYAPRSALLLGRVVSMKDMEAVVASVPGVRAVHTEWRWNGVRQQPVAQIWYIGAVELRDTIIDKLHKLCDPSTPIDAQPAIGILTQLALEIEIDERYVDTQVLNNVEATLWDKRVGLLRPEQLGIGRPLYRSHIFDTVVDVSGVLSVRDITWNGQPFVEFAVSPKAGCYFDFEAGAVVLNGRKVING